MDAKRRNGTALEGVPEAKRAATGSRPTRSAPVSHPAGSSMSASVGNAPSTASAATEATFEEIAEKTGQSVTDILNKKVAFKKGTKPEKKLEEMMPMIKELRYELRSRCFLAQDTGH